MPEIDPLTRRSLDLFLAGGGGGGGRRYPVVEAWLYGSRARGDAREDSDVDLALVMKGEVKARSVAADMGDEKFDVLMDTGRYVAPFHHPR